MGTTELFVELIVIGVGALIWMVLGTLGIFGYDWVPLDRILSISALIPFLSMIYIIGIITDRIADVIFEAIWVPSIQRKHRERFHIDYLPAAWNNHPFLR